MEQGMRLLLSRFARDTSGATVVEYGLVAALLAVGLIGGLAAVSGTLNDRMEGLADDPLWDAAQAPAGG
jgi:pilus assembly protein Flp/PilA